VVFVTGKGGTGKTTVAAALALIAARHGKRVLAVDVEARGDLAAALGSRRGGFEPILLQPSIHGIELRAEESFREYLNVYFKVPRIARLTPLARIFDFIATGVPGPRDMLVVGKIAYEERRRQHNQPVWDIIVVDSSSSGHAVAHLTAARSMLTLVKGGVIGSQVQWIDELVRDHRRSGVVITALPEEMPVVEAVELRERMQREAGIDVIAAVLNQAVTLAPTPAQRQLATALCDGGQTEALRTRLGGDPAPLAEALEITRRLHDRSVRYQRQLRGGFREPVLVAPLVNAKPGLATARIVAGVLEPEIA